MCDEIDAAAELELLNVEIALKNRQRPAIEFTGQCHYCEEAISKGNFCSKERGEDYQKVERAKQFKGGGMSIEWNGEGMPPVGCECGARKKSPGAGWWNFKVEHISSGCIFGFWKKSGAGAALDADQYDFMPLNPICTEAECKREKRIGTMNGFIDGFMKSSKGDYSNLAAALHDYLSLIDRLK